MNKLNYTEEIFNILSRGGFISNNSVQAKSSGITMPSKTIRQNMMSTTRASDSIWKQATATSFLPVRKPRWICCVN